MEIYELQKRILDFLKGEGVDVVLLDKKEDLSKILNKPKIFMQYTGINYKSLSVGTAQFTFYLVDKRLENKDGKLIKMNDILRDNLKKLYFGNLEVKGVVDKTDSIRITEEKYNNTPTLEFIYTMVLSVDIMI